MFFQSVPPVTHAPTVLDWSSTMSFQSAQRRPAMLIGSGVYRNLERGDTWGSGGLPPAGSRGSAPVGGQGGESFPLKLLVKLTTGLEKARVPCRSSISIGYPAMAGQGTTEIACSSREANLRVRPLAAVSVSAQFKQWNNPSNI